MIRLALWSLILAVAVAMTPGTGWCPEADVDDNTIVPKKPKVLISWYWISPWGVWRF